jgi:hypothetical protein
MLVTACAPGSGAHDAAIVKSSVVPTASSQPEPTTFSASLGLSFESDDWVIGRTASDPAGEMCMFLGQAPEGGQLDDLQQATLADAAGEIVAVTEGGSTTYSEMPVKACTRTFEFAEIPTGSEFFTFEAGPYRSKVLTRAELESNAVWKLNG